MSRFAAVFLVFVVTGTAFATSTYLVPTKWRYRLIVTVETPEGVRTGSSVREVTALRQPRLSPHVYTSVDVEGEAVVVDLGGRGILFALINWDSYYEVFAAFPRSGGKETTPQGLAYYKNLKPGLTAAVPPRNWPEMINFDNLQDPTSVRPVSPNLLYTTYGEGVKIQGIFVEVTEDAVDSKIGFLVDQFGGAAGPYDRSRFERFRR